MKLIKITKENESKYFSTKKNAAKYIGVVYQNLNYYMENNKEYKGWKIEESYDNVWSNEIDNDI